MQSGCVTYGRAYIYEFKSIASKQQVLSPLRPLDPGRHHKEVAVAGLCLSGFVGGSTCVAEMVATLASHVEAALPVLDHVPGSIGYAQCGQSE